MPSLAIQLTDAGLAAVQGAAGSDLAIIAELGLTATPFDYAPTLTAVPGEFKRLPVTAGVAAAPNITHLSVYDTGDDAWSACGFGLYLSDGTLFAYYSQTTPVLTKAGLAFAMMAFDIAFNGDMAANIEFGDATFAYPPATEQTRGVARIATQARVSASEDGGDDGETIVTPRTLRARLASFMEGVSGALDAFAARRITGAGLVRGGGNLAQDRELSVIEASANEITDGTAGDTVVTPRRLGPITMLLQQNGFIRFFGFQMAWGRFTSAANLRTDVDFAEPFPTACFSVVVSGVNSQDASANDNTADVLASTVTASGFAVFSPDNNPNTTLYIAVGH